MNPNQLEQLLEAVLFYRGEPVRISDLAKSVHTSETAVEESLNALKQSLEGRGIRLLKEDTYVSLATAPDTHEIIEAIRKEELEGPLGKAGLETLAIVIYNGPLSRADIEYIRGVNSSSILRSLTMRGLVEKVDNPRDKRSYLYQATPDLPAALGVTSLKELPDFESVKAEIANVLDKREPEEENPVA